MDHTMGNKHKDRSKPPSLLACISCRRSHLKCDGHKPLCRRCAEKGCECLWIESRRGYRDYRKEETPPREKPCRKQQLQQPRQRKHDTMGDTHPFVFSLSHDVGSDAEPFVLDGFDGGIQPYTYEELFPDPFNSAGHLPSMYTDDTIAATTFQIDLPSLIDPTSSPGGSTGSSAASMRRDMSLPIYDSGRISHSNSGAEPMDLLDIFYKYFYAAHPFIVPKALAAQQPELLPKSLRATMRFIAAHYFPNDNVAALQRGAQHILSDRLPDDVFKLQGLMLYACACFARYEQSEGALALDKAIRLALKIGINKHSFALAHAPSNPILQESFRRTWWSLFLIDGLVTAIGGQPEVFRLQTAFCDVPLPCDDKDYNNLYLMSSPRSLSQFRDRTISEDPFPYSSHAYAIEAMYIMGAIFDLGSPTAHVTSALDAKVAAIDASISHFLLSLPPNKREVTPRTHTGLLDEPLLLAHMTINWASIQLHRPRSSLTFMHHPHHNSHGRHDEDDFSSMHSCAPPDPPSPTAVTTSQSYTSHTSKALLAANNLVQLGSLARPPSHCTPMMICAITVAATVLLPAYSLATAAQKDPSVHMDDITTEHAATAIREKLQLCISTLGRFAECWPRAKVAKRQVAGFAREILSNVAERTRVESNGPRIPLDMTNTTARPGLGFGLLAVEGQDVDAGHLSFVDANASGHIAGSQSVRGENPLVGEAETANWTTMTTARELADSSLRQARRQWHGNS